MARPKSAASPLAIFLDYILTTTVSEAKAALEASIAALGARQRVVAVDRPTPPIVRQRPDVAAAVAAPSVPAVPATTNAAVPRRGRPAGSGKAKTATVTQMPGTTSAPSAPSAPTTAVQPRRRRPSVTTEAATATAADTVTTPAATVASTSTLPDQAVDRSAEE